MIKNKFIFAVAICFLALFARTAFPANESCEDAFANYLLSDIEYDSEISKLQILSTDEDVIEFFAKNFDLCRDFLVSKGNGEFEFSFDNEEIEADIVFSWEEIREAVATIRSAGPTEHAIKICENNRSYQMGIEVILWTATAISAAATFYAGGTGGAVAAAITQSAKIAAKEAVKKAVQVAIKKGASKTAKATAKKAALQTAKKAQKEYLKKSIKAAMTGKLARYGIKPGVVAAVTYFGGRSLVSAALGKTYSMLESGLSREYVNCQDLDTHAKKWGGSEFCYRVCGENELDPKPDSLNKYVMTPMFKKVYCISRQDFGLYEMNDDGTTGSLFVYGDPKIWEKIKTTMAKEIQDKKGCDWSSDDVDAYTGFLSYSPETLRQEDGPMTVVDVFRIDE